MTGAFALTEPNHGSDVAGGMETSARREGHRWIINGESAESAVPLPPVSSFQMIQDKLVGMLGNTIASLGMVVRLSQQQDSGVYRDQDSALAKTWTSSRMRDTVAGAREIAGGNGILLENDVARFFADAEAIYTYEGTREINTLVVGRAITERSAFTR